MASIKTLNAANLETLGAARLAALLIEVAEGDAAIKRRLRLELMAEDPAHLAKEIRKRLATIDRSRGFINWQNRRPLLDDLEAQRRAIVEQVAPRMPAEGFELIWQFIALAESIYGRCDDSGGIIQGEFHFAMKDLGTIASAARPDPERTADRVFTAITTAGHGQYDRLIPTLKDALGPSGLERLKQRVVAYAAEHPKTEPSGGTGRIGDVKDYIRQGRIDHMLRDIADAQGDVDAYIAQYDEAQRTNPKFAAEIADRLLAAGRAAEAWQVLDAVPPSHNPFARNELDRARIAVLDALGRTDDAQAVRWATFERTLASDSLRDYLKRLPDFEDFDAEQKALDYAEHSRDFLGALRFLTTWPALDRAARLVITRTPEINGDYYDSLTPAVDALAGKYPLVATLLLRAMIDFTMKEARFSRYGHAARHLHDCAGLAPSIADWGDIETHDAYVARLRKENGRKTGFWTKVD